MLWTIIAILILLWIFGLLTEVIGGLIHIILVIALVVLIIRLIRGR
ncbi:lmo0937 family membrane protein [Alteribacter lacisalsi]|nr:lmo0937 family membrane protein [Alteribacter lacisalsi]